MVTTAMGVLLLMEAAPFRPSLNQDAPVRTPVVFSFCGRRVPVALTLTRDPTRRMSGPRIVAHGRSTPERRRRGLRACEIHSEE